ncbi:MAG: hypothetical protein PVI80_22900 [Anaerolineae bacterium]|jgi:hypothetical protein
MKCNECGSEASEQDLFCGECGAILAPAADEPVVAEEPAAIEEPAVADDLAAADAPTAGALDLPLAPIPPESTVPPPASPEAAYYEPAYDVPAAPDTRARVALVLGIVSIGSVTLTCVPIFGLIGCIGPAVGIAAIILGFIVKRDIRASGGLEQDWKRANLGMILGVAGVVLYVVFLVFTIVLGLGMGILRGY